MGWYAVYDCCISSRSYSLTFLELHSAEFENKNTNPVHWGNICHSKLKNNNNSSTGDDIGEEDEDLDTITTIVVPAVCAVIVLASLILVFFVCRLVFIKKA